MDRTGPLPIPLHLLVLDVIGALLLGLGLAEWFADTGLVPAALRFEYYPQALVVAGALLMLPLLLHLLQRALGRAAREI